MLFRSSVGGVVGPLIVSSLIGDDKGYTRAYTTIAIIALVSIALPLITKTPKARKGAGDLQASTR